jgi:hypothetical protein
MVKLIRVFRDSANAPKNELYIALNVECDTDQRGGGGGLGSHSWGDLLVTSALTAVFKAVLCIISKLYLFSVYVLIRE